MQQSMAEARLDLAVCLERVRQQDEEAARALVAELHPLVIKIVRAHLPRRMDEEDLAQTVFAKVFAHLGQYSGRVPFTHWVSRVAVNTCLNALRSEKSRPELRWADLRQEEADMLDKVVLVDRRPDPSDQLAARDLAQQMLKSLPPKDRLIISLLDLEERSVLEVKELTGWSAAMIKIRAFRARMKLRKQFAKLMQEATP